MGDLVISQTRSGVDTLYYTETDTGNVGIDVSFPTGKWEPLSIGLNMEADGMAYDKAPGSLSVVASGSGSSALRRVGIVPVGNVMTSGGNYWMFTYDPIGYLISESDYLQYYNGDLSTSTGTKIEFIIRARRVR